MADLHDPHGGAGGAHAAFQTAPQSGTALKTLTHLTGAGLSLALLVGVGVWGYKLVARDVSGIPVVRAAAGEMRVRPEDPGGQLARNTGLAVNAVAAEGIAAAPADTLHLAPKPVDLAPADITPPAADPQPVAAEQQPELVALDGASVDELVAALTQGVAPIEAAPAPEPETPAADPETATLTPAVLSGPDMNLSLRPVLRPADAPARVVPARAASAPAPAGEIDAQSLPSGTRLAQLGAYDSAEVARTEWARLADRFGRHMDGRTRVVQQAQSGGRTFYRLRAHGFDDLAEARRFCAALSGEGQDCIPVETR